MNTTRKSCPSDASDAEWEFLIPYLVLTREDVLQRKYPLRELFKAVRCEDAKRSFVLLPPRWIVERSFGWLGRFRRLARDYERLNKTLEGWHWFAFAALLLAKAT